MAPFFSWAKVTPLLSQGTCMAHARGSEQLQLECHLDCLKYKGRVCKRVIATAVITPHEPDVAAT